jgi:hypothetical protein
MTRAAGLLLAAIGLAPMQCAHEPDPALRQEDTAGDALWALALRFEAQHDDAAEKETLRYLVEKYPSSRHVAEAKAKLGGASQLDGG